MKNPLQRLTAIARHFRALYRYPPGHFYSPLPDTHAIASASATDSLAGIDLRTERQRALLHELAAYYPSMPFSHTPEAHLRYSFANPFFCEGDATLLHLMLRHFQPQRVIEVGSGHSSAVMLDTAEQFGQLTDFTFIEPYPERLYSLIRDSDTENTTILERSVQAVPLETFQNLTANDILFIDSSHVAKYQSDVNYLFFEVLPNLQKDVLIHIHDIFYPFEYPEAWLMRGRAWNEAYLLRAFLQFNTAFEIVLFNDYIVREDSEWFRQHMPLCLKNPGGSLWLRKVQ